MRHKKFIYSFSVYVTMVLCIPETGFTAVTQDDSTCRANTLSDDADDLQRQLDNEARDRLKYGRPKPLWMFNFPRSEAVTRKNQMNYISRPGLIDNLLWSYLNESEWKRVYLDCGGHEQSPINLLTSKLLKMTVKLELKFTNHDVPADTMQLRNDGRKLVLYGTWRQDRIPTISEGAAMDRRYVFHSLHLHWPSEHAVEGTTFPLETQALHIGDNYQTLEAAVAAGADDPFSIMIISNVYMLGNSTHQGVEDVIKAAHGREGLITMVVHPLSYYVPKFNSYAFYHGSLSYPPCSQSVLWIVRGRTLTVKKEILELAASIGKKTLQCNSRKIQPHYERSVILNNAV